MNCHRLFLTVSFLAAAIFFFESHTLYGQDAESGKPAEQKSSSAEVAASVSLEKQGNITPMIVDLTPEEEAKILEGVSAADGFDLTLFAPSQTANYPVFVAAAPNGDLYVSSDGNGSLGREAKRGRVLRLRDKDGDGRADEVTEFVKEVDSPRGLIWDHDRLYLLHPPHISVFYDKDGDGVAEDSKRLIDNIAFDFSDRPADHTTNDIELGIDGWIYIAGGDFGFVKATGSDGRELQHRGGGVIRFRPDGSGLELFATGTRNILAVPTSPLLDIFSRDNTNDGGGWDVRFHHFSGLEDHGYPRLYKNFADEHVHPLADYGGGSGCGAVYIDEPGFPDEWNSGPFTCDWGKGALFRHSVERVGASFKEVAEPQPFIKMSRPTDASVDAMSRVYQASWKGATFKWAGPDAGFIVAVQPSGYQPEPLPDFDQLGDGELVALLASPSHIRTLTAQRTLLRRELKPETSGLLLSMAKDGGQELSTRVAALYALSQRGLDSAGAAAVVAKLEPLASDSSLAPFVMRALGDMAIDRITQGGQGGAPSKVLIDGMKSPDPRTRLEAMVAAARQGLQDTGDAIAANLGHEDARLAHTAFQALGKLQNSTAAIAVLFSQDAGAAQRKGASHALMRMHSDEVVDELIDRLKTEKRSEVRNLLLATLARLHHRDGEWEGASWGTRPDTRGPFYQLETWDASERILIALKGELASAAPPAVAALVSEMNRNRIRSTEALDRIITMAAKDPALVSQAVAQIAAADSVPGKAIPLLLTAARRSDSKPDTLALAVKSLATTDDKEALAAMLSGLVLLDKTKGFNKDQEIAQKGFLDAPKLENHHLALEKIAREKVGSGEAHWARIGLLALATRKSGSPESRELSQDAISKAWKDPRQKIAFMKAAMQVKNRYLDERILIAAKDPSPEVAKMAAQAMGRLKIKPKGEDNTPKLGTLSPEEQLATIIKAKGDIALGEAVFERANCVACHTTKQSQVQKGPYLGNIAETYKRSELAEAIIDPNKTIAQGFATNVFYLKDGKTAMGFVTDEAGDYVVIRDIASNEHKFKKDQVAKRETLPTSMMPPALMNNFSVHEAASLLDYLVALAKKK